jgi:hypothetical protein
MMIGTAMTIGTVAGVAMAASVGAFVDATRHARLHRTGHQRRGRFRADPDLAVLLGCLDLAHG